MSIAFPCSATDRKTPGSRFAKTAGTACRLFLQFASLTVPVMCRPPVFAAGGSYQNLNLPLLWGSALAMFGGGIGFVWSGNGLGPTGFDIDGTLASERVGLQTVNA